MKINVIKVPVMYGSSKTGVEYGPRKIEEMGLYKLIEKYNHEVNTIDEVYIPIASAINKRDYNKLIKYYEENLVINKDLAEKVELSLKENFTLIIGGDHVLGLGSVLGSMQNSENLGVFWIDAHCDINTEETSFTQNAHGMPLAFAMGIGDEQFANLYKEKKLNPESIFIIGARDIDEGEYKICDQYNVNLYDMDKVNKQGLNEVLKESLLKVEKNKIDKIHLSIDVDSLDKKYVPGTGTPVDGGFNIEELKTIIREIMNTKKVQSVDVVELNPRIDDKELTAKYTMEIIECILSCLKEY